MTWDYEPDENPKRKHGWGKKHPGFINRNGHKIGKCPSDLGISEAEKLVNNGIEWSPEGWPRDYPKRIYVVRNGWVYRATPTIPGRSYHGFPEIRSRLPNDRDLHQELLQRARDKNCAKEIERWLSS
jgi:hypothetical protein